jgi:uncharacterized cupredoxin-like copper-binding protein
MNYRMLSRAVAAALALTVSTAGVAGAQMASHGGGHSSAGGHGMAASIGQPGDASKVSRTVEVTMYDNYYEPESIAVSEGETIRFIVRNAGEFVHEFNIATAEMHQAHGPEMMMLVEHGVLLPDRIDHAAAEKMKASMGHGMHGEGNSVLLEPGKTGEVIWTFAQAKDLEFACNVPGHYDAGMMGEFKIGH